ncbi:hypothetical protein AGLY_015539 [Aphis glycines]|uniref:Uncharacterized protein n=1 Tax=Aphis glycines TaxID=307491 RepID=A0A6G0T0X9_APHGL|nr:hypothetical protein AGLY_015539 [Aphis glycines]
MCISFFFHSYCTIIQSRCLMIYYIIYYIYIVENNNNLILCNNNNHIIYKFDHTNKLINKYCIINFNWHKDHGRGVVPRIRKIEALKAFFFNFIQFSNTIEKGQFDYSRSVVEFQSEISLMILYNHLLRLKGRFVLHYWYYDRRSRFTIQYTNVLAYNPVRLNCTYRAILSTRLLFSCVAQMEFVLRSAIIENHHSVRCENRPLLLKDIRWATKSCSNDLRNIVKTTRF